MPELNELIDENDEPRFPTFSLNTLFLCFLLLCNIPGSTVVGSSTDSKKSDLASLNAVGRVSSSLSRG